MEAVTIDDELQCKISTNGKEDIRSFLTSSSFTPLKVFMSFWIHSEIRLEERSKSHFDAMLSDSKQLALYQTISHYGDLLYASDEELAASSHHNDMLLTSLCLHVLNHITKVVLMTIMN